MQLKNKKGFATIGLIAIILIAFFILVLLVIYSFGMDKVDETFKSLDGTLGNQSLNETYQQTLGKGISASKTTFPQIMGTLLMLGMVFSLIFVGYKSDTRDKLWIILDIVIIIVAEIFAVIVKESFSQFMNSTPEFLEILRGDLSFSAKYVLNLPVIIPVIGAIIILATYLLNKVKPTEEFF